MDSGWRKPATAAPQTIPDLLSGKRCGTIGSSSMDTFTTGTQYIEVIASRTGMVVLNYALGGSTLTVAPVTDPAAAPTLATATTGGTLPAATYYVVYTWVKSNGETLVSPETSIVTTGATSTITVTVPALPSGVTSANIYISTATGTETKQGNTATTSYTQTAALIAGTAKPVSNTTTDYTTDTSNQLKRIDDLPTAGIDLVLLQLGGNDETGARPLGTWTSTLNSEFYGALHSMAKKMYDKFPTLPFGVLTPQYRTPRTAQSSTYIDATKSICSFYSIPCLDLVSEGHTPYTYPTWATAYAPDGTHLNDAGNAIISYKIQSFIKQLLGD